MATRTGTMALWPRTGGLNTTLDEGVLPPGTLTKADNVIFDFQASIRRREGVNYDYDSLTASLNNSIVGGIDFWFGTVDSKAQFLVSVRADGTVYRTSSGTSVVIPDGGLPWVGTLTEANLAVFNNRVIIAVSGVENRMKYWDGDPANPLRDLPANAYNGTAEILSVSRSSAGTTRTLVLNLALPAQYEVGDDIIVTSDSPSYAGSYTLASIDGARTTITYVASTALTETTIADLTVTLGEVAPLALFLREHIGSLWCNDKTRLDRIHYSGPANQFAWLGYGFSGAIDIGQGDGDPAGITGLSPTFKGDMFVGKRTKLYRLYGQDPDTLSVIKMSNGIGFLSHQAVVAVDQDDIFFVSFRGIHSLNSTNAYGAFTAAYLSKDIQQSFVNGWSEGRKRYIKAEYLPEINSALFAVSEKGQAHNNAIYLYNIELKYWYRWPVSAETLISAQDTDRRRVYLGTSDGRLAQTQTSLNHDVTPAGLDVAIVLDVATGILYPDQRPDTIKGFKRIRLVYKAQGSYTVSFRVKIDNFSEQAGAFVNNEQAVPLEDFILGVDVLGGAFVTAPYSVGIDGYGRGIKLFLQQSDNNTAMAIQGFMIEFEQAEAAPETRLGDND